MADADNQYGALLVTVGYGQLALDGVTVTLPLVAEKATVLLVGLIVYVHLQYLTHLLK